VCMCVIRHILAMSVVFCDVSISGHLKQLHCLGMKIFCCVFFVRRVGMGVSGRIFTRWVGLQVISEKMEICSHLQVVKIPYPQNDS
jgi:hypothetical protein